MTKTTSPKSAELARARAAFYAAATASDADHAAAVEAFADAAAALNR